METRAYCMDGCLVLGPWWTGSLGHMRAFGYAAKVGNVPKPDGRERKVSTLSGLSSRLVSEIREKSTVHKETS